MKFHWFLEFLIIEALKVFKEELLLQLLLLLEDDLLLGRLHDLLLLRLDWFLELGHFIEVVQRCVVVGGFDHHSVLVKPDNTKVAISVIACTDFFEKAWLIDFVVRTRCSAVMSLFTVQDVDDLTVLFVAEVAF